MSSLYDHASQERYRQLRQHAPGFLFCLLCDNGDECEEARGEFERLLETGARISLIDDQMRGNLKAGGGNFIAAYAELEVASFLDVRGVVLTSTPSGRGAHVGDLQAVTDPPTFIEVKAVLDRPDEAGEQAVLSGVFRYVDPLLEEFAEPALVSFAVKQTGTFNRRHLESWVRKVFSNRGPVVPEATYTYQGLDGLLLEMQVTPVENEDHPVMTAMTTRHNLPVRDYLLASIQSAYDQLPDDGRPSLVILRPHLSFVARELHLLDTLLGRHVLKRVTTKAVTQSYPWSGVYRANQNTRVSAVGLLDVKRHRDDPHRLAIIHNPWARHPLAPAAFALPNVRQLVPGTNGDMHWHPSDSL
jgi:hypothetical protein